MKVKRFLNVDIGESLMKSEDGKTFTLQPGQYVFSKGKLQKRVVLEKETTFHRDEFFNIEEVKQD